jgi:hypothetical protein
MEAQELSLINSFNVILDFHYNGINSAFPVRRVRDYSGHILFFGSPLFDGNRCTLFEKQLRINT